MLCRLYNLAEDSLYHCFRLLLRFLPLFLFKGVLASLYVSAYFHILIPACTLPN